MEKVECVIQGYGVNFDQAREIGRLLADEGNDFSSLVSWCDREKGVHSPSCLKCELEGEPGWEVYGRNHGGRLRISFDDERFVFIYS